MTNYKYVWRYSTPQHYVEEEGVTIVLMIRLSAQQSFGDLRMTHENNKMHTFKANNTVHHRWKRSKANHNSIII